MVILADLHAALPLNNGLTEGVRVLGFYGNPKHGLTEGDTCICSRAYEVSRMVA